MDNQTQRGKQVHFCNFLLQCAKEIGTGHYHAHLPILAQITSQVAISIIWSQYRDIWDQLSPYIVISYLQQHQNGNHANFWRQ